MGKRENPLDRFTPPTPENQAGQVNGHGRPLRVHFVDRPEKPLARVRRIGEGSD